ncbi:MAG: hypothetical protein Q9M91_04380 [Candidatus Dojkabacteria bacterium]|nr:hypothetical protein [Candidatus Dojkabacteria bacterium]
MTEGKIISPQDDANVTGVKFGDLKNSIVRVLSNVHIPEKQTEARFFMLDSVATYTGENPVYLELTASFIDEAAKRLHIQFLEEQ